MFAALNTHVFIELPYTMRRRSILVRTAVSQEGPKNPSKGISTKPVVPAANAQFGVGAGGRRLGVCVFRAISNGMEETTLLMRRPDLVRRSTSNGNAACVRLRIEPAARCILRRIFAAGRCVQSSLPCVGLTDRGFTRCDHGHGLRRYCPLKYSLQKRLRDGLTAVEDT